jgi:hypothetical protein
VAYSRVRAIACLGLACAAGALLCACGSGQAPPRAGGGTASAAGRRDGLPTLDSPAGAQAHRAPSRAQALGFARAVNLGASDIPGASIAARTVTAIDARERREYRACERSVDHGSALAELSSAKLERGDELETEQISSGVTVLADEHEVAREFAALRAPALRECLARALTRNFAEKAVRSARWGRFTVTRLPVQAPGASATVGIRVTAMLNFPFSEISVPIYVDMVGFAVGPAEVGLSAASVTQPVPAGTEQELLALLLARAKAHPL